MNLLVHFVIYGHSWCFESSQIALAYGSCNFENFQNITRAHKSRNALVFIRFPILNALWKALASLTIICPKKFLQESVDHPSTIKPPEA